MCTEITNTGFGWKVNATGGEGSGKFLLLFLNNYILYRLGVFKINIYEYKYVGII